MAAAAWGFAGSLVGAATTLLGFWVQDCIGRIRRDRDDAPRKKLLVEMLGDPKKWRDIETLSRVIGASREETARLLISIGARGSEAGKDVWALIKNKPLP